MHRHTLARATQHLAAVDPVLSSIIMQVGVCRLGSGEPDLFTGLARSIVSQQLSVKAAVTIYNRICALAGVTVLEPAKLRAVPPALLRTAGISVRKAEYLHDLAERIDTGTLSLDALRTLDDDRVVELLTTIRGIGRWTAEMILIFRLARPDVLPLDDVGLQRAVQRAYGLKRKPTPSRLTRMAEPWRPYRSVACWYLWTALDTAPQ